MIYTNEELGALVERLDHLGADSIGNYGMPICNEAAAAIRQLMAERDELLGPNPVAEMLRKELAALRKKIEEFEPAAWLYYENGEECFGHPDGYRPDDAVALYTLEGIKK